MSVNISKPSSSSVEHKLGDTGTSNPRVCLAKVDHQEKKILDAKGSGSSGKENSGHKRKSSDEATTPPKKKQVG